MAEWCMYTGRSMDEYLKATGYERKAFEEEAKIYRKKGAPI